MKINIIPNKLYFATEVPFKPPFWSGEEGVHFWMNLNSLDSGVRKLRNKRYVYEISTENIDIRPLYIDSDILLWSGKNLAELFLCKLNNEPYEECFEGQGSIPPEVVKLNVKKDDEQILNDIINIDDEEESFYEIMRFIKSKGYTCISYLIWEGDRVNDRALIFDDRTPFDYSSIKLLKILK